MRTKKEISITKATKKEIEKVKDILNKINFTYSSLDHTYVAKEDEEIIGIGRAEFFQTGNKANTIATIAGIYVHPKARGKNIGLTITQKVIKNFPKIKTWYLAGHPWIELYYKKVGFKRIHRVIPVLKRDIPGQVFMELKK